VVEVDCGIGEVSGGIARGVVVLIEVVVVVEVGDAVVVVVVAGCAVVVVAGCVVVVGLAWWVVVVVWWCLWCGGPRFRGNWPVRDRARWRS